MTIISTVSDEHCCTETKSDAEVINKKQIERMVTMCGASLPNKFVKMMARYENNPEALKDAAIAYAVDQIVDLISQGVHGIHLYTMNKPDTAKRIYNSIASLLKC